jgi:hypothetical protein
MDSYEARCKAAYLDTIKRSKPVMDPSASVAPVSFKSSLIILQMTECCRRSKQTLEFSRRRRPILSVEMQPLKILLRLALDHFGVRREAHPRSGQRRKPHRMSQLPSDPPCYQLQLFQQSSQKMVRGILIPY